MLHGEHLTLTYQDGPRTIDAVHDVAIYVEDHQFVGILGPSGSGKSSLLYLLSGLRSPTQGEIYLDDRAFSKMSDRERVALRRSEFGFVFQQHFLINYLTALENVMVAALVQDRAHSLQAKALLADLGLGSKLNRLPYELSGGERQRVAIARAMIHRPRVIFADEPTGLLDRLTGSQVMALLRSYRDQGSLIAVTHNPEILTEADLVITMRDGQIANIKDRLSQLAESRLLSSAIST
ncbi:MAG TPA: ATP-binding cassette domain-containing protein [Anaerolineae bacterium]|jgi:putative ABC transport system ATP-binding protein|nr:ATP-binding cassette domain-containing protein [Anaerolineae bacterium]